jgi:hypothetical protein
MTARGRVRFMLDEHALRCVSDSQHRSQRSPLGLL